MRYITAIRMSPGGTGLQHIERVRWRDPATHQTGDDSRASMVAWIDGGGDARVQSSPSDVKVQVVRANPPYLRTLPNDSPNDNLLKLPRF